MTSLYPLFAFMISVGTMLSLRRVAPRVGLLDHPGGRKTHFRSTPLVGGIGIFAGVALVAAALPNVLAEYGFLLSLTGVVLALGTLDDVRDLPVSIRMTTHVIVAVLMAKGAGVELTSLGQIVTLNELETGWFALPLTIFATVGVINAINMVDGIDGLAGGLVSITLGFLTWMAISGGDMVTAGLLTLIICSILAFLGANFRRPWRQPALVYLGDAGSNMLGFILAWFLIDMSQGPAALFTPVYALWFLAVPLFDTVHLLIKRTAQGRSPFKPGTDHLHHQLERLGLRVEVIVALLLGCSIVMGLIGMAGIYLGASDGLMFLLFLILFATYSFAVDRISTPEPAY